MWATSRRRSVPPPPAHHHHRLSAPVVAGVLALVAAGCGDDDTATTDEPTPTSAEGVVDASAAAGATIEVTAIDYGYEGIPPTIEAGTAISLVNASDDELHEFVAIRLPDGEDRPVEELVQLPESELGPLMAGVSDVVVALPGHADEPGPVKGDGVLSEPGRYAIICVIPVGADPQAYLSAAQAQGGPPQGVEGGPPHVTQGMFAEVVVQ
jgi:hypothetical protein